MTWEDLRERFLRAAGLFTRDRRERELDEELAFHLAMKERSYVDGDGLTQKEAAMQAKRDFGNVSRWKELCRDVARWRLIEEFGRDLSLAARTLRKSPAFTLVALATLTLAIGANTAIFSLMNAIVLRPVPLPAANRLGMLRIQPDRFGYAFMYPLYKELEKQSSRIMEVFAFTGRDLQVRVPDGVERVSGQLVSGHYFSALGVQPTLGRWIGPNDDRRGAPDGAVVVVSDRFWRTRLGGDPHAVGRRLTINQISFTVAGVMPEGFRGMNRDQQPDVFVPFELEPLMDAPYDNISVGWHAWWFQVGMRLNGGVTLQQANAFLRAASSRIFDASLPPADFQFDGHKKKDLYLAAEPGAAGYSYLRLQFKKPLTVLMALVVLVLLIACLNLATLLMARAASRTREITTRFALGASRARLIRQLLTESLLLAACGTALGLLAAPALARLMVAAFTPRHDPLSPILDVSPDWTVFAFTAGVAILATALTGIAPALRSTGDGLRGSLQEGSATLRGAGRRKLWPRILMTAEVGLALVLVTGATLLAYSMVKLRQIPIGFEPQGLVYLPLELEKQSRQGPALTAVHREVVEEVRKLPGVAGVSLSMVVPLSGNWSTSSADTAKTKIDELWQNRVGPDYFQTMRTPFLEGRDVRWTDSTAPDTVAILNQAAAKQLFPGEDAVGQHFSLDGGKSQTEVIGVVGDAKYSNIRDAAPPTMYAPVMWDKEAKASYIVVIRASNPGAAQVSALISAAQAIIRRNVPDIPPPAAVTMEQTLAESLATERMMSALALFFGALALLITAIGLYGTLAYATERRTGEIGIRLALGAQPRNVISLVCGENGAIALAGCVVGIAGSVAASKLVASFLYGVSTRDPAVFGLAALVLLAVAAVASLAPAIRAARIDPLTAIRHE